MAASRSRRGSQGFQKRILQHITYNIYHQGIVQMEQEYYVSDIINYKYKVYSRAKVCTVHEYNAFRGVGDVDLKMQIGKS